MTRWRAWTARAGPRRAVSVPDHSISVLDGTTFVVSDRHGDLLPDSRLPPHGFFSEDTRFISRWRLRLQDQPTHVLNCAQSDYYLAQFFLVASAPGFRAAPSVGVVCTSVPDPERQADADQGEADRCEHERQGSQNVRRHAPPMPRTGPRERHSPRPRRR